MKNTVSLKKNRDFSRVYRKASFLSTKNMVLYVLNNRYDIKRLGITIGKKVGKAVKRNRIRRLVKENYRIFEENIMEAYDIVFVIRKTGELPTYKEIQKEMKYLLKKSKILSIGEKFD
jgi:ribonuclease P protein component